MYKLTLTYMVQIVKKIIFTKPDALNSMSKKLSGLRSISKNAQIHSELTQAKTCCDHSKITLNVII